MAKRLPASVLQAGRDYPRDYAGLCAWFPDDEAYLDYLERLCAGRTVLCARAAGPVSGEFLRSVQGLIGFPLYSVPLRRYFSTLQANASTFRRGMIISN